MRTRAILNNTYNNGLTGQKTAELNEMSEKKKYYIGVSILNCYEVDAKNEEEAEEIVRNYSHKELLDDSDFNVNYIDEIKE